MLHDRCQHTRHVEINLRATRSCEMARLHSNGFGFPIISICRRQRAQFYLEQIRSPGKSRGSAQNAEANSNYFFHRLHAALATFQQNAVAYAHSWRLAAHRLVLLRCIVNDSLLTAQSSDCSVDYLFARLLGYALFLWCPRRSLQLAR